MTQIAILNLGGAGRTLEEQTDSELGKRAHLYDTASATTIAGRIHAIVPDGASEELIGRCLRAEAARVCPICGDAMPTASRDRRVAFNGIIVCGKGTCEESAGNL